MTLQDDRRETAEFLFYTPGAWERNEQLWTIRAGHSVTKPGYQAGPKRIDCYSLHFIVAGELELLEDGRSVTLREGDLFCLFPERTYTYRRREDCLDLRLRWIAFGGPAAEPLLDEAGITPDTPFARTRLTSSIMTIIDQQFRVLRNEEGSPSQTSRGLILQSLLLQLLAALIDGGQKTNASLPDWVEQSIAYIELHAAEGLTVERLAEMAGLHRNYFSTAFTAAAGKSPQQIMTEVRMKKAAAWLKEQEATVTEIAYSLGYSTPYSFTRAFARYYGMPPTVFRERTMRG
ncbi:AraC family transcriptional regulator [Paenibacillus soyae]|uniref:AraC family transcriptional regulator n=1 Tax=Paenibacillus soyae TaxID=2969249 RepID=A0A9X2MKR5_9BACL|nr:AraC family transcriptional regulator [Paenibacillus soyae]MCR2803743.1 AraC family transcriptional regulator [Paenibacillus soyae]